jgi:hypothetical protein
VSNKQSPALPEQPSAEELVEQGELDLKQGTVAESVQFIALSDKYRARGPYSFAALRSSTRL